MWISIFLFRAMLSCLVFASSLIGLRLPRRSFRPFRPIYKTFHPCFCHNCEHHHYKLNLKWCKNNIRQPDIAARIFEKIQAATFLPASATCWEFTESLITQDADSEEANFAIEAKLSQTQWHSSSVICRGREFSFAIIRLVGTPFKGNKQPNNQKLEGNKNSVLATPGLSHGNKHSNNQNERWVA